MTLVTHPIAAGGLNRLADVLYALPTSPTLSAARRIERLAVNPVLPIVFIVVVAIAAFVALAILIGAIAAYIYYCQSHGGKWPGIQVPGASGGVYKLGCFK